MHTGGTIDTRYGCIGIILHCIIAIWDYSAFLSSNPYDPIDSFYNTHIWDLLLLLRIQVYGTIVFGSNILYLLEEYSSTSYILFFKCILPFTIGVMDKTYDKYGFIWIYWIRKVEKKWKIGNFLPMNALFFSIQVRFSLVLILSPSQ